MCNNQKVLIFTWGLFISAVAVAWGNGVREIEIKPDLPDDEKQIFTVRFAPDETIKYDQIVFDCTLRQELVLFLPDGGQTNKIFESGIFTSRQRNVKMVKDVDCYVSFFVQLGTQRSADIAKDSSPKTNAPVTVARMKITTYREGKADWTVKTNARGKYRLEQGVGANSANAVWKAKE